MSLAKLSVTVIVVARNYHGDLLACLKHLKDLDTKPAEVLIVGAQWDDPAVQTARQQFPEFHFLPDEPAEGASNPSHDLGVAASAGDVVVFIDDTSRAEPSWLNELMMPYEDESVAGVSGRVANGIPGEATNGISEIGCLLPNGNLTDNFGADPGRPIEVDHVPSTNVSFRRTALESIGGIRRIGYPGRGGRELTDAALRLRAKGGRLIFQPAAVVEAPAAGRTDEKNRMSYRFCYTERRDHVMVLLRALGWRDPLTYRFLWTTVREQPNHVRKFVQSLGRTHPDGSRRRLRERLAAPEPLTWIPVELSGLAAGFPAAFAARRNDLIGAGQANSGAPP
ncbi:glycosyltransferase family 2 protein [Nesterenkonia salmonea]|uniref:glycosyltransferase family 2 protein n=1 Tax=Nesterenkonia salmonea TaxID=1804987 RepID=UPI00140CB936|nr:glycosyltransferase [Nesterenkonia salmonea]